MSAARFLVKEDAFPGSFNVLPREEGGDDGEARAGGELLANPLHTVLSWHL